MPRDNLYVANKQFALGIEDLIRGLTEGDVSRPRKVADAITKFLIKNTTQQFLTVERWALRNVGPVGSSGYDAFVVFGATADDSTRTYPTVFEAIRALDSAGFVTARIGVVARNGTITETANLGARSTILAVSVEGADGGSAGASDLSAGTKWDHGGFSTSGGSLLDWQLHNMTISLGAGKTEAFQGIGTRVLAWACYFDAGALSQPTIVTSTSDALLIECHVNRFSPSNIEMYAGYWVMPGTSSTANGFQMIGTFIDGPSTVQTLTVNGTSPLMLIGCMFEIQTGTYTIASASGRNIIINGGMSPRSGGKLQFTISGHLSLDIDIANGQVATIGAPAAASFLGARLSGTWDTLDITGPVNLNCVVSRGSTLRGKGITGVLQQVYTVASGTAVTGVAMTDSSLLVEGRLAPGVASSTQKFYALDASSTRNVIVIAGRNEFPTASTDAGSSNNIITDIAGAPPTGAAGGDLSGSYPNPAVVDDSHNHTAATVSGVVANGDAAGGDLSGTYPNPTVNQATGDFRITPAGAGIFITEGANATMGLATLVGGTVTVATTQTTANSRIFLTVQALGTVLVPTAIAVTARVAGTSFDITSADVTDTSDVAWLIVEP